MNDTEILYKPVDLHDIWEALEKPAKIAGAVGVFAGLVVGCRKCAEQLWRWFIPKFDRYTRICLLEEDCRRQFGDAPATALRKALEEMGKATALQEIKATLLANQLTIGFYVCRADTGDNIFANPVLADIWGLEAREMRGVGWVQCLVEDDRSRALEQWQFSIKYGLPYHCIYKVQNARTGKVLLVETRATLTDYIGETKAYSGWVKVIGDMEDSADRNSHQADHASNPSYKD